MAYVGRKSGNAALIAADIPSNLHLLGSHVKIPSVTTANLPGSGDNSSITPVNGMLVYNSTLGRLQQRAGGVWSELLPLHQVLQVSLDYLMLTTIQPLQFLVQILILAPQSRCFLHLLEALRLGQTPQLLLIRQ
jgi:hypothetical protein